MYRKVKEQRRKAYEATQLDPDVRALIHKGLPARDDEDVRGADKSKALEFLEPSGAKPVLLPPASPTLAGCASTLYLIGLYVFAHGILRLFRQRSPESGIFAAIPFFVGIVLFYWLWRGKEIDACERVRTSFPKDREREILVRRSNWMGVILSGTRAYFMLETLRVDVLRANGKHLWDVISALHHSSQLLNGYGKVDGVGAALVAYVAVLEENADAARYFYGRWARSPVVLDIFPAARAVVLEKEGQFVRAVAEIEFLRSKVMRVASPWGKKPQVRSYVGPFLDTLQAYCLSKLTEESPARAAIPYLVERSAHAPNGLFTPLSSHWPAFRVFLQTHGLIASATAPSTDESASDDES